MKKLFISQPIDGKTRKEIEKVTRKSARMIKDLLKDTVEIVDSFVTRDAAPEDVNADFWYLGESIKRMGQADIVYFAEGYQSDKRCMIEYLCASAYGMRVITEIKNPEEYACPEIVSPIVQAILEDYQNKNQIYPNLPFNDPNYTGE